MVIYALLRLGVFVVSIVILLAIGFNWLIGTILASVFALSISLLAFGKQRNAASTHIFESRNKSQDRDGDVEDKLNGDDA